MQQYFAIPGNMIGLTGRDDLESWHTNLYLRREGHWADFEGLNVYNKQLIKTEKGHAGLDIFDYNYETYSADPIFERFRITEIDEAGDGSTPDVMRVWPRGQARETREQLGIAGNSRRTTWSPEEGDRQEYR